MLIRISKTFLKMKTQGGGGARHALLPDCLGRIFPSGSTLLYFAWCPWKLISWTVSPAPVSSDICWGFGSGRHGESREVWRDRSQNTCSPSFPAGLWWVGCVPLETTVPCRWPSPDDSTLPIPDNTSPRGVLVSTEQQALGTRSSDL